MGEDLRGLGQARRRSGLASLLLLLSACNPGPDTETLHVYAASSLTEAFQELERHFESENPGVDVALTFAGSQILRVQIEQGAPADIFASANPKHMRALVEDGRVFGSRIFAQNELVVIVPPDNPAGIQSFADLTRANRLVLGTEQVPIGTYTRRALERAEGFHGSDFADAVLARVVSEEANARLVRAKVELGEADAAVVYRTDAVGSEELAVISIPTAANVRADYPIGVVDSTSNRDLAERWLTFVLSERGQAILERHGFLPE